MATLHEMIESVKSISGKRSTNDLDDQIRDDINRVYRSYARKWTFNSLIVKDEEFETEDGVYSYTLPYMLSAIVPNSIRYDVQDDDGGVPILLEKSEYNFNATRTRCALPVSSPIIAMVRGAITFLNDGIQSSVLSTLDNGAGLTTIDDFDDAAPGDWFTLGVDANGLVPPDYGYKLLTVTAPTQITFAPVYRGPTLATPAWNLRPQNSKLLEFAPSFSEYGKTVTYDWVTLPQRLYNGYDIPEVPELCDAIIYRVLADNPIYSAPDKHPLEFYTGMANDYLKEARATAAIQ